MQCQYPLKRRAKGPAQQYNVVNIGTLFEMKPSEYED